jgi:hypothetical protein
MRPNPETVAEIRLELPPEPYKTTFIAATGPHPETSPNVQFLDVSGSPAWKTEAPKKTR